jgi:hypothetical protein
MGIAHNVYIGIANSRKGGFNPGALFQDMVLYKSSDSAPFFLV